MAQRTQSGDSAPARARRGTDPGPPSVRPDLCALLDAAGLTGRDVEGGLSDREIASAQESGADLIVIGCEGELGPGNDAYVLTSHLDEVAAAAAAITSGSVRYAARRGTDVFDILRQNGVPTLEVPDRLVVNQSVRCSLKPTLVVNAESLWRIAQVLRNGPQWFRSVGLPSEPGPRLITIRGAAALQGTAGSRTGRSELLRGGVFETRSGVPFGELLAAAGACRLTTRAVLVGGLAGGWLSAETAWRLRWSTDSLSGFGLSIEPGVVAVLEAPQCPVCLIGAMLAHAASDAGECETCRAGVSALALAWRTLAAGEGSSLGQVERELSSLTSHGPCRFSAGLETFAASSLQFFGYELLTHASMSGDHPGACQG